MNSAARVVLALRRATNEPVAAIMIFGIEVVR